jgi:hypothetical protein
MYAKAKMRPDETVPGMGRGKNKGCGGGDE